MQVSWIDPREVAALAELLRPARRPPQRPSAALLELLREDPPAALPAQRLWEEGVLLKPTTPPPEIPQAESTDDSPPREAENGGELPEVPTAHLEAIRQRLQAIRDKAVEAGLITLQPPAAKLQPNTATTNPTVTQEAPLLEFATPVGNVMTRLDAYCSWVKQCLGGVNVFLVDDRGDLLYGPQDQAGLMLSLIMAASAVARASAWSVTVGAAPIHHTLPSGAVATIVACDTRLGVIQVAVVGNEPLALADSEALRSALIKSMDLPT